MKKISFVYIVYLLAIFIQCIVFFVLPVKWTASDYVALSFMLLSDVLAFLLTFYTMKVSFEYAYSYPLIKSIYAYVIVQFLVGLAVLIGNRFIEIKVWIVVVVSAFILVLFLIVFVLRNAGKIVVENEIQKTRSETNYMSEVINEINMLKNRKLDDEYQTIVEKLYEKARYSDPVSNGKTIEIEQRMLNRIRHISQMTGDDKNEGIKEELRLLSNELDERNALCRLGKERARG